MDLENIGAEASAMVTREVEAGFPSISEAVLDMAIEKALVPDIEDYTLRWIRPGGRVQGEGVIQIPGSELPKGLVYVPNELCRKLEPGEVKRLESGMAKGDHYDTRTTETTLVVRSNRTFGWRAVLEPIGDADGYELPDDLLAGEADGLGVWRLRGLPQLRYESRELGHCVGNRSMPYWRGVEQGTLSILSLRVARERSVMTFEVRGGQIMQAQGKSGRGFSTLSEEEQRLVQEAIGKVG